MQNEKLVIPVQYFIRVPNVGDRVNPELVARVTKHDTVHVRCPTDPHILAIGSVLTKATKASRVWGTGLMKPDGDISQLVASNVKALRGALTRDIVFKSLGGLPAVPIGDPGILVPQMLGITRSFKPRYQLGIVPHYVDRWHPFVLQAIQRNDVLLLDVTQDEEMFLRDMADCAAVASSSLHGLIFAEALRIPNVWVKFSDQIAGGSFKFLDWFTTTQNPRKAAIKITKKSTVEGLILASELAESKIDRDALLAALDAQTAAECARTEGQNIRSVAACRRAPLPCFLISYNRGSMLKQCIASLKRQTIPTDIIIHDNGSDDPTTRDIIHSLESDGIKVYRNAKISSAEEINTVNKTVQSYFADWAEPTPYLVSDCDIDLSSARADALEVFHELLTTFRSAEVVGPMLRIRDIPEGYPLRNHALNRHVSQFWGKFPEFVASTRGMLAIQRARIDTTLAIHRAGTDFKRLKSGVRVYEPFEARHLDWYLDPKNDSMYAKNASASISHWSPSLPGAKTMEQLKVGSFVNVPAHPLGRPFVQRVPLEKESRAKRYFRTLKFRMNRSRIANSMTWPACKERECSAIFVVGTRRSGTHFLARTLAGFEAIWDPRGQREEIPLLRSIAEAALKEDAWPEQARNTYRIDLAVLPRNRIYLDQHHPNLFFVKDIITTFGSQFFIFLERPTEQIVASMLEHSGVRSWFDFAKRHAKNGEIKFPNQFLGLESQAELAELPMHLLCARRALAHDRVARRLVKQFPSNFFILPFKDLVTNQLMALSNCLGDETIARLGNFKTSETPNPDSLRKYQRILTKSQILEIRDLAESSRTEW